MTQRSPLARLLPDSATTPEQIRAMAAAIFHQGRGLFIPADAPLDEWHKQIVENIGGKLYGKRTCSRMA